MISYAGMFDSTLVFPLTSIYTGLSQWNKFLLQAQSLRVNP